MQFTSGDLIAVGVGSIASVRWVYERWISKSARQDRETIDKALSDQRDALSAQELSARVRNNSDALMHLDACLDGMKIQFATFTARHDESNRALAMQMDKMERSVNEMQAQIRNIATRSNNRFTDEQGRSRT